MDIDELEEGPDDVESGTEIDTESAAEFGADGDTQGDTDDTANEP